MDKSVSACLHPNIKTRELQDITSIPDWCPLPDQPTPITGVGELVKKWEAKFNVMEGEGSVSSLHIRPLIRKFISDLQSLSLLSPEPKSEPVRMTEGEIRQYVMNENPYMNSDYPTYLAFIQHKVNELQAFYQHLTKGGE